jgi:hypothetical protein
VHSSTAYFYAAMQFIFELLALVVVIVPNYFIKYIAPQKPNFPTKPAPPATTLLPGEKSGKAFGMK